MKRAIFGQALVIPGALLLVCLGAVAQAEESGAKYALQGTDLVVQRPDTTPQKVPLGCRGRALLKRADRLYVACGGQGVVVLRIQDPATPKVLSRQASLGEAVGFFIQDGRVWVKIARLEAHPLGSEASPAAAAGSPQTDPPASGGDATVITADEPGLKPLPDKKATPALAAAAGGTVLEADMREVVINLGLEAGVKRDDKIELFTRHSVKMGQEEAVREEVVAVGVVTLVSKHRARVRLGLNERVPVGAGARPTVRDITESIVAPPRADGLWELEMNLRPFLPLEELGFGMLIDASFAYRFSFPMVVMLCVEPLGFAATDYNSIFSLSASVAAALDLRLFEVGIGLGASTVNGESDVDAAFTITQRARFGALDGLHLEIHNLLLFYKDEFHWGGTSGTIQIPLASRWWILLRGGGGEVGYAFGEGGLRVRLKGNGHEGSVFLAATLGWGMAMGSVPTVTSYGSYNDSVNHHGPLLGLGLEWRP